MKKILILCISVLWSSLLMGQHSISINGPSSVNQGEPANFTLTFNPDYNGNAQDFSGLIPDSYVINEWIVITKNNDGSSVAGYVGKPSNTSNYYNDATLNNRNPITIPIQWGNASASTTDIITVKVSGYYKRSNTGEITKHFNYQPQATKNINIIRPVLPQFTLTSNMNSINCGSTDAITFTVNNVKNSTGTLTYNWYVNNDWYGSVSSNSNTITLKPIFNNGKAPSNIKVVPVYKGVDQYPLVSNIILNSFVTNATIKENNLFCGTQVTNVFTIDKLPLDCKVNWSSSNPAIAKISSSTNSQATVTSVYEGTFNLNAEITNVCGQTTTITKALRVGKPYFDIAIQQTGGGIQDLVLKGYNVSSGGAIESDIDAQNITNITWEVVRTIPESCGRLYSRGKTARLLYSSNTCRTQVKVTCVNSCGTTTTNRTFIGSGGGLQKVGTNSKLILEEELEEQKKVEVFPNPAKDVVNIVVSDSCQENNNKVKAQLFDLKGTNVRNIEIINNNATFSVQNLPKGIYILKVIFASEIESQRIIIE
jgi:Secretion system C-terminal sorting domain/PKD-like domain